jgi:branched-chain amino acid transport system permease protein
MGLALLRFGPDPLGVSVLPGASLDLLGGRVRLNELALLLAAAVITAAAYYLVHRTRLGLAGLARAEDPEAASLRGIDVRALSILGFVAAGIVGGLIGPLVAQKTYAVATLGLLLALKGFIALAVGGVGSITGSLVGGMVVALIEAFAARYLGNDFGAVSVILLLFAVLLLRPDGILGRRLVRVV